MKHRVECSRPILVGISELYKVTVTVM